MAGEFSNGGEKHVIGIDPEYSDEALKGISSVTAVTEQLSAQDDKRILRKIDLW